jgi:hypothetical protein
MLIREISGQFRDQPRSYLINHMTLKEIVKIQHSSLATAISNICRPVSSQLDREAIDRADITRRWADDLISGDPRTVSHGLDLQSYLFVQHGSAASCAPRPLPFHQLIVQMAATCPTNTPTVFPKRQLSFYAALLCIVAPVWAVTPLSIFTVGWLAATRPLLSLGKWELALFIYCTLEVSLLISMS